MRIATRLVLAAGLALVIAGPAAAQPAPPDAIIVGALPQPGQSQRLQTTQRTQLKMVPEGELPPGFPAEGLRIEQTTVTVMRQDIGLVGNDGRVRHDITYESMTQTSTMNGKEVPIPFERVSMLNGKVFTMWIDRNNDVVDVVVPEGVPLTGEQAKQMIGSVLTAVPRQAIRVGETVSKPFTMDLPVPGGREAPKMTATTRLTLTGVDGAGTDRIANFDVAVEGLLKADAAGTGPAMSMTVSGTGTMRTHLLSGFVVASTSEQTIDGTFSLPGGNGPLGPAFTMRGTVLTKTTRLE
jgi:hypothetical protein